MTFHNIVLKQLYRKKNIRLCWRFNHTS